MDEEKIEDQLIDKFIRRLKKIRDKMDVDYKLTTYDTTSYWRKLDMRCACV